MSYRGGGRGQKEAGGGAGSRQGAEGETFRVSGPPGRTEVPETAVRPQMSNLGRLRVSLKEDELQTLESREERRQQQLHDAILKTHLELQVGGGGAREAAPPAAQRSLCV